MSGIPIDVTRGWTAVDAKVGNSPRFRFVNTHLESFDNQPSNHTNQDTDVGNGKVRKAQAQELIAPGGPAAGKRRVILVCDLNSDVKTHLKPGDGAANWWLLSHGFKERSTHDPLSCCLDADVLRVGEAVDVSQLDHKVDNVMTNDPEHVKRARTAVTGRSPHNGFWDSDHAGLFSSLSFRQAIRPVRVARREPLRLMICLLQPQRLGAEPGRPALVPSVIASACFVEAAQLHDQVLRRLLAASL